MNHADNLRVYQEAKKDLARLHEEDRKASEEQRKRTEDINAAYAVITFLSKKLNIVDGEDSIIPTTAQEDFANIALPIEYPTDGTWQEKIIAVIKHFGKVVKIADMVELIMEEEAKGGNTKTLEQITGVVSNNSSKMVKDGQLKTYTPARKEKGYYYGNPLWWVDGKLKDEYLPEQKTKMLW